MAHRWSPSDTACWARLAVLAGGAVAELASREDCRRITLGDLRTQARRASKVQLPCAQADWPRFAQFQRLAEDFAGAAPTWRRAWARALGDAAAEIARRTNPAPSSAEADQPPPWWMRD